MEVGAQSQQVSAVTRDTPLLPLLLLLMAQGLEFRLDLAIMGHILADLHILRGTHAILRPEVAGFHALLEPSFGATDDGQAGQTAHILGADHVAWLCMWVWLWLLMLKMQGLAGVRHLLRLTRMLQGLTDVRVPHLLMQVLQLGTRRCQSPSRHSAIVLRFSGSGYWFVSTKAPSGTLGLGTSAAVERF